MFTFRCDGADFHLTKSHKKILKNFNNFLQNGKKNNRRDSSSGFSNSSNSGCSFDSESVNVDKNANVEQSTDANESSASEEIKMITSNPKVQIDIEIALKLIEVDSKNHLEVDMNNNIETIPDASIQIEIKDVHKFNENVQKSETNIDRAVNPMEAVKVGKQQLLKAKLLRQQRTAEKQIANASSSTDIDQRLLTKKVPTNTEKTLKSLIEEMPNNGKHKLKVCV